MIVFTVEFSKYVFLFVLAFVYMDKFVLQSTVTYLKWCVFQSTTICQTYIKFNES